MYDQAFELATGVKPQLSRRSVYPKVDLRVTLFLCGVYFLQFIDKSLLNYAAVMGIKNYLAPNSNQFSNLGTITYVAYIVGEPFQIYFFLKCPAAKVLGLNIICWGAVVIGHAFAKSYSSLMAVRFFLGFFEVSVAPGCTLITGMWFDRKQQLHRTCWWTCQAGVATIVGGALSFAFQHVHSDFESWQILCLVFGILTVIWGFLFLWLVPDSLVTAKFLTDDEKVFVLENIRDNQTGTATEEHKWDQVKELLLRDKLTWLMLILTLLLMIPTGAVLTFSATIIANIGFSSKHAALMQMPVGVSTIWTIVTGTYLCAYFDGKHRNWIFISMLVPAIIGYIVLVSSTDKIGQLLSVYLINVGTCVITMLYSWNSANTSGYTKRIWRTYLTMGFFAAGALIGPQFFRASDAPRYIRAKVGLMVITIVCIPLVVAVTLISRRENKVKEQLSEKEQEEWLSEKGDNYQFMDMTDKENLRFRYSY